MAFADCPPKPGASQILGPKKGQDSAPPHPTGLHPCAPATCHPPADRIWLSLNSRPCRKYGGVETQRDTRTPGPAQPPLGSLPLESAVFLPDGPSSLTKEAVLRA